jgi:hypothetical protein
MPDRSDRINELLKRYCQLTGEDHPDGPGTGDEENRRALRQDLVEELMIDLMDHCDYHGINFDDAVQVARDHHEEETKDGKVDKQNGQKQGN